MASSRKNPHYVTPDERTKEVLGNMIRDMNALLLEKYPDAPLSTIAGALGQLVFVNTGVGAENVQAYEDAVRAVLVTLEINAESTKLVLIEKGVLKP